MWAHVGSWLWTGVVFVLMAFVVGLKGSLKKFYDHVERTLLDRLIGRDLFQRRALRNYVRRLHNDHRHFILSFQPHSSSGPMDMLNVYVKLSLVVSGDRGARAQQMSLADVGRAVVLGAPGAGKTMLLRHTVLTWAHERYRPDDPSRRTWYGRRRSARVDIGTLTDIPIRIELSSIKPDLDLRQQLIDHLATLNFSNAGRWLDRKLADGGIAFYFDGLDEVSSAERPQVVEVVRKFLTTHDTCRAVITCRDAVYAGEFNETIGSLLHVEPFDDQLISRFLYGYPWPAGLGDNTAGELLGVLRDTPRLMSLARNPLVLAMIVYLHCTTYLHTGERLPYTRAGFYKQVVGSLLGDRNRIRNARHSPSVKLDALQRIALAAQDVPSDTHDRLALSEKDVLRHIEAALEDQHRLPEEALEVLETIVERTGLLLRIDGGVRYQFAHLTLQEYLAATMLADDPRGLLERYARDPVAWRETVRLWCGVEARDCSDVVREVYERESVLAFQCLADAQVVDPDLADRIIGRFRDALGTLLSDVEFADVEAIVTAFGGVAADRREPGPAVFHMLYEAAQDEQNWQRASEAMAALAATRVPRAAELLVGLLRTEENGAEFALTSMGDLAVPALSAAARDGIPGAVHTLWQIRTVSSARVLCEVLRMSRNDNALGESIRFAAYLGDLLRDPEIEKALDDGEPFAPSPEDYTWVWRPFASAGGGALVSLVSWISWALARGDLATIPEAVVIDPRITVPLALVLSGDADSVAPVVSVNDLRAEAAELIRAVRGSSGSQWFASGQGMAGDIVGVLNDLDAVSVRHGEEGGNRNGVRVFSYEELSALGIRALQSRPFVPKGIAYLQKIPIRMRLQVMSAIIWPIRSSEEWTSSGEPPPKAYVYDFGWHYRLVLGLCLALSVAAGVRASLDMFGSDSWGPGWLAALALVQIVVGWLILLAYDVLGNSMELTEKGFLAACSGLLVSPSREQDFWMALTNVGLLPTVSAYAFGAAQGVLGTISAAWLGALIVLLTAAVAVRGRHLHKRFQSRMDHVLVRELIKTLRG